MAFFAVGQDRRCRGDAEIVIRWCEADGPPVTPPSHQGFGTRLVGPLVQTGLGGKIRYDWYPSGLACEIIIPPVHVAGILDKARGMGWL